jgi:hypothetical protein
MRTTHRRAWKHEEWLVVDERTGATHYASEMVREPDTGLMVHRSSVDPKHPLLRLRPKYKDPAPVSPVIPAPSLALTDADRMLLGYIGSTTIPTKVAPASHIFNTGVGEMIIEGVDIAPAYNEFTDLEVDTTVQAMFPSGPDFP